MTDSRIIPVVMPKWGLSMKEGKVTGWLVGDGKEINVGEAILEVETDKIAGAVESTDAGVLRRRLGTPDTMYPVKALLGVIADPSVPDAEIDAFIAAYVTPVVDDDEASAGPAYEFVEASGLRLRYAKRGDGGDAVVLIHGFGGDLDNWLFNIDALAENATVYALDLPGHGQSAKAIPVPTVEGLANVVLAFMGALNIPSAHLVGHSLGGAIAMQVSRQAAARARSVAVIGSAGFGSDINMDYISGFIGAASRKELKPVLEKLFADPGQVSRQMVDDVLKYKRLDGVDNALRELAGSVFKGGSQQALLQPGQVPTIAIWGREDQIVPASHAANAGTAKVEIIDKAGHMVQMEQASRVNALIRANMSGR